MAESLSQAVAQGGDRSGARLHPGRVQLIGGQLVATIEGVQVAAKWVDGLIVEADDPIIVATTGPGVGQSSAVVLGRATSGPRPGRGQVTEAPAGSDTITITAGGVTYTALFGGSYTPVVGDNVLLLWQGDNPVVLDKVGTTPAPVPAPDAPPAPAPPPPAATTGRSSFAATDTGTFDTGNGVWSAYYARTDALMQGASSGYVSQGTWFYGNAPTTLAGRTITRTLFRVPARRRAGNYNAPLTLHLYRHTHRTRAGQPPRVEGPFDVIIPPFGQRYVGVDGTPQVALPAGWGQALADDGGGISIYGDPYGGVDGRSTDPASGQLTFEWSR